MGHNIYTPLELLKMLGFSIALDFDGELLVTAPAKIEVATAEAFVQAHREELRRHLFAQSRLNMRRCIGGPLHGRQHNWYGTALVKNEHGATISYGIKVFAVRRRCWACYSLALDGRAFFVGYETSQRRARQLAWTFVVPA